MVNNGKSKRVSTEILENPCVKHAVLLFEVPIKTPASALKRTRPRDRRRPPRSDRRRETLTRVACVRINREKSKMGVETIFPDLFPKKQLMLDTKFMSVGNKWSNAVNSDYCNDHVMMDSISLYLTRVGVASIATCKRAPRRSTQTCAESEPVAKTFST
jgi:hypothetical protein